jgi:hypothetical protein
MAQLSNKIIKYLDRKVDFATDVILQDDGQGAYIKEWNIVEAQPTEEQLNALESQANDMEALNQVYANRKSEYPSIEELVVALYDTEDKLAIETKRAEVKAKYPKE